MDENKKIGLNIKRLREKMRLSQDDLATYLGINRTVVSYYETGEREIPTQVIEKCSRLFGIDEIDLYEENVEQQIANVAFAFKVDALQPDDLVQVAAFRKIVKNYLRMSEIWASR